MRLGTVLFALFAVACSQAPPPPPAAAREPSKLEGMWSDPPATAVGTFCFFSCTDAGIDRLNALLDDPANDKRPFPQLQAEAAKYQTDTYLRPRMTDPVIQVEGLRKSYGDIEAVRGIDLAVGAGEVFAFLGPNGAGKTTTVEVLEGYRDRNAGEVTVLGVDPASPTRSWRERIGIVLQECRLTP